MIILRNFHYLCRMDANDSELRPSRRLKDEEILEPFMEYLEPTCIDIKPGESIIVYRTQSHVPVDEYGQLPRPRRKYGDAAILQKLTKNEVDALPQKKRERIMAEWGLSCNNTEDAAQASFINTYKKLQKRGASKEDLEAFVQDRGNLICRYILTCDAGIITAFDDTGHANFYLYEGVELEAYRDKNYGFTTIDYQNEED